MSWTFGLSSWMSKSFVAVRPTAMLPDTEMCDAAIVMSRLPSRHDTAYCRCMPIFTVESSASRYSPPACGASVTAASPTVMLVIAASP